MGFVDNDETDVDASQTADEVGRTEAFGGDVEEFIGAEVGIVKVARDFIP